MLTTWLDKASPFGIGLYSSSSALLSEIFILSPIAQLSYSPSAENYTNACMPVIALPRINAAQSGQCLRSCIKNTERGLTVDVALALICLGNKEICNMSANVVLIADCIATKNLLKSEATLAPAIK